MRPRFLGIILVLFGMIACESRIHRLLESPPPPNIRLGVTLTPASITVVRGAEREVAATVVRVGDGGGQIAVSIEGLPTGVTARVVTTATPDGATAAITVRADLGAAPGNYTMTVFGKASGVTNGTGLLVLSVVDPPDYSIGLSQPAVTIARGGIARVTVGVSRTNIPVPLAFSLTGQNGIRGSFAQNPLTGDTTDAIIAVDADVAPGTYEVAVRGVADGVTRSAPITVRVTSDPLQVIASGGLAGAQLATVTQELIVNRATYGGALSLTAEGLPVGVVASIQPPSAGGNTATLSLAIGGSTAPGTYPITIRASGNGVPDATAELTLTVSAASIALSVSPGVVTLAAGGSVVADLMIERRAFAGPVMVQSESVPAGVTVAFDSTSLLGNRARATVSVASSVVPGAYAVKVRAVPVGLSDGAAQVASIALTVRPPGSAGAVVLDWSRCRPPKLVAMQDGSGAWTPLTSTEGLYIGDVGGPVGGFAFVDADNGLSVRYMTLAELTGAPLEMCKPVGTRVVHGTGIHIVTGEAHAYSLGGGLGTSSLAQPRFAIVGVRDGVHDLVATLTLNGGSAGRAVIRRDIVVGANPDTLAPVQVMGPEGTNLVSLSPITVAGSVTSGESFSTMTNLLTTAACTVNPLRAGQGVTFTGTGGASFPSTPYGLLPELLRPTDFYLYEIAVASPRGTRTSSVAFRSPVVGTLPFAPELANSTVSTLPGSYKRLQAALGGLPAVYNRTVSLHYGDARTSVSVVATRGYLDATSAVLAAPDLSAVSGWPDGAGVPASTAGNWRVTAEGSSSEGSACVQNRTTFSGTRVGVF